MARARLRRERALATLLVLFALGFGEPLLCIIHCQLVLPITFHDYLAAQIHHGHHHHMHSAASSDRSPADTTAAALPAAPVPLGAPTCALRSGSDGGSVPFHLPPSPIHEMLLALIIVLPVLSLRSVIPVAAPPHPPTVFIPPPLRPPILAAA